MNTRKMRKIMRRVSLYPPYLGAGIKVKKHNADFTYFYVEMKLRFFNKNIYGTHFGGSLYAMTDPFFVFIILNYLGDDYTVWDKSAGISFLKPGRGKVSAEFFIDKNKLSEIKSEVDKEGKKTFFFRTKIKNEEGETVAEVKKEIYVKKKTEK